MPFTPFHMGPGLLIKALLQGSFSLMVFGWTQIVMDLQPLFAIISGSGKLHGFTHTFIGATLIAILAALTGKHLSEWALRLLNLESSTPIRWWVAWVSAFLGSFSHVLLDGLMHLDMEPFWPFTAANPWLRAISIPLLHKLCVYSGLFGGALYVGIALLQKRRAA